MAQAVKELILWSVPRLQPDDVVVTSSGDTGEDLKLSPAAREYVPLSIECKNQEALNIWSALKQAEGHSDEYPGVVFFKRNNSEIYVAMNAKEFLDLITRSRLDRGTEIRD